MTDGQPEQGRDLSFVEEGAVIRVEQALTLLGVALVSVLVVLVDFVFRTASHPSWEMIIGTGELVWRFLTSPTGIGLLVLTVLAGANYAIRRLQVTGLATARTFLGPEEKPSLPGDGDLLICCSGGGIKSASFCLGGLQRLHEGGAYQRAHTVVAVSGGGYAAAAFAVMRHRLGLDGGTQRTRTPFGPGSAELYELRRRTNYIGQPGRTRFDLGVALLAGIALSTLILGTAVVIVAWLLGQYLVTTGMVTRAGGPPKCEDGGFPAACNTWQLSFPEWVGSRALLVPFGVVVLIAVAISLPSLTERVQRFTSYAAGRRLYRVLVGAPAALSRSSFSNVPSRLLALAFAVLGFCVVMPWAAVQLHNGFVVPVRGTPSTDALSTLQIWATAVASLGTLGGLVSSMVKGMVSKPADSNVGKVLDAFRQAVAPLLAVLVFVAIVVAVTSVVAAWFSTAAFGGQHQVWWFVLAVVTLVALRLTGSSGWSTVHRFYRDRLRYAYLDHGTGLAKQPDREIRLDEVATGGRPSASHEDWWPGLTLVATANVQEGDVMPSGRGGTPFVLGEQVGLTQSELPGGPTLVRSDRYTYRLSASDKPPARLGVAMAAAISGAAVAPTAGRESKRIGAYRLLLAFANIRLGVWIHNPKYPQRVPPAVARRRLRERLMDVPAVLNRRFDRPTALNVVNEAYGRVSIHYPYLYVTDGGHYDNLGLAECLRRRPRAVIVLDGTGDAEDQFPVLGDVIATARMDDQVTIRLNPAPLFRGGRDNPLQSHVVGEARYADCDTVTKIVYIRCVLPRDASWDLRSYRLRNPDFPSTLQRFEMFDEFDFEAYRELGHHLVDRAFRAHVLADDDEVVQ